MDKNKLVTAVFSYLDNVDMLDYPYGLQIVEEELGIGSFSEKNTVLLDLLISLRKEGRVIVGDYKGPDEIQEWSDDVDELIEKLKVEVQRIIESGQIQNIFWVGLPNQKFLGH